MEVTITFLGTGGSSGVPEICCDCSVCKSDNPKNKRLRPSICITYNNKNILVDTTPDFRTQILDNNIVSLDGILYTHHHADHVMGLADIRPFNFRQKNDIPAYADSITMQNIKKSFSYIFDGPEHLKKYFPQIEAKYIDGPFEVFGLSFIPFTVMHAKMPVLAFRFKNIAYVTDVNFIPEKNFVHLNDLDLLILDAFRYEKHISHFSLEEAVNVVQKVSPKKTLITHISHAFDHEKVNSELPDDIELAYDGLKVRL